MQERHVACEPPCEDGSVPALGYTGACSTKEGGKWCIPRTPQHYCFMLFFRPGVVAPKYMMGDPMARIEDEKKKEKESQQRRLKGSREENGLYERCTHFTLQG